MKKLKPKQILIIVLALIIGAAIIAFPFIFNAVKAKNNDAATRIKTIDTVNLPKTGSKTLNGVPDTANTNLLKNGSFSLNTTGQTEWTYAGSGFTYIIDYWRISSNTTLTIKVNQEESCLEFTATGTETTSGTVYLNMYYTDQISYEAGDYTISIIGDQTGQNVTAEMRLGSNIPYKSGSTIKEGNINYLTYTLNNQTRNQNPFIQFKWFRTSYTWKIYGVKIEKGSICTAPLGMDNTQGVYEDAKEEGYQEGQENGYNEGYEQGKDEIFDQMKNMQIAGPNMAWEANGGITGSYNSTTDTLTAGISENSVQYIRLDTNITLETGMGISVKWKSISPTSNINLSFDYQYATGTESYGSITTANINDDLISFIVPEAANGQKTIYLKNYSGANVNIQGLKIYQLNSGTTAYENGYQAGLNQGNANAGQQYDNGYQAGLAAGRAEGTATENFAMLFPAIFGSLLSFFVNTGEGITIFGVSLWSIAVTFIAILVITKVVKLLL